MAYRIVEHTADIGIEATAPDIPILFSEAVRAMAAVVLDADPPEAFDRVAVAAEADDLGALLAEILQEALWRFESSGWLPVDVELEVSATTAAGTFGVVKDVTVGGPAIKAVTYHQLAVERTPDGWLARVFFDV
ncbi:MAG TPA: archease [Actinomycetota bacterium]|nr:archease [Actinomycetota bacterium]